MAVISFILVFIFVLIALAIACYVLNSLGLYTLAKHRGLSEPWIAWIPIVSNYLLGELTGNTMWGFSNSKWILTLTPLVLGLLSITGVGMIISFPLSIAYTVYFFMVLFKLYKTYVPEQADLYIITSIVFQFMICIWIFIIRNKQPVTPIESQTNNQVVENKMDLVNQNYEDVRAHLRSIEENSVNSNNIQNQVEANQNPLSQDNQSFHLENEINKSINDINLSAQKAMESVEDKKPIKLHLDNSLLEDNQSKQQENNKN